MAPSSPDISILQSTSTLFAFLDLNHNNNQQQPQQNMADMDIDEIIEVPDTPDRLVACKSNGGQDLPKEISSSVDGGSRPFGLGDSGVPQLRRSSLRLFRSEVNGNGARLRSRPSCDLNIRDQTGHANRTVYSVSDSPSFSPKGARSKRISGDHVLTKNDVTRSHDLSSKISAVTEASAVAPEIPDCNGKRNINRGSTFCDAGKSTCAEVPSRSFAYKDDSNVLCSTPQRDYSGFVQRDSHGLSKSNLSKDNRKGSIGCSSHTTNSCEASKGMSEGSAVGGTPATGLSMRDVDLSSKYTNKAEQVMPRSSKTSSRSTGQRRLVRNGVISPCNIEKAQQIAQSHGNSSRNGKEDSEMSMNGGSPSSERHIVSPNTEGNPTVREDQRKGKGVMIDSSSTKPNDEIVYLTNSKTRNPEETIVESIDAAESGTRFSKQTDGWRSTRRHSNTVPLNLSHDAGYLLGRNNNAGHLIDQNYEDRIRNADHMSGTSTFPVIGDPASSQHARTNFAQVPSAMHELGPGNAHHTGGNILSKRQRKHSVGHANVGECSISGFDNSENTCSRSSQGPGDVRSTRKRVPHHRGTSGPIIEIDELSPEIRGRKPEDPSQMNNAESDTRASQVEADELLARQLQEQFYNESHGLGGGAGEIDASIAWELQQQEDAQRASLALQRASNNRDSTMSHLYTHFPSESTSSSSIRSHIYTHFPSESTSSSSFRSMNRARGSPLSRAARMRTAPRPRSILRPPSRGRHPRFPANVDIETRIHILEALEAAVSDRNSVTIGQFFPFQRDFNEDDYEMLLALDEDNYRHAGASANQINGLPQSTVQTNNFEETCAICLETPTIGNTIRHLPCLHKFHKDCIDPWLSRSTSCPICKSSIT